MFSRTWYDLYNGVGGIMQPDGSAGLPLDMVNVPDAASAFFTHSWRMGTWSQAYMPVDIIHTLSRVLSDCCCYAG